MQAPPSIQMEATSIDVTLANWRRKATNTLMVASALVYLPVVLIVLAGQGPAITWPIRSLAVGIYAILPLELLLWRVDYRVRAGINLAGGYVLALVVAIALPQGPFIRAFPLILPVIATVFFGRKAGRIATGISTLILLFAPLLSTVPSLAAILIPAGEQGPEFSPLVLFQGIALTAILLEVMVLLDGFHDVLMQSLADRIVAYRRLDEEMQQRRRLEYEVARAADEERQRLGHEIHDGVCQQITAALLRSEALTERLDPAQARAREELSTLSALLEETIGEARAVAHGLCPLEPNPEALAAALQTLANRIQSCSGVACALEMRGDVTVRDSATANHLYRIAQEAISNAVKHAHANRICVTLQEDGDSLVMGVEDDGDGMPEGNNVNGMGLRTMHYRAHLIGGSLSIMPGSSGGTRISCRAPRSGMVESNVDTQGKYNENGLH